MISYILIGIISFIAAGITLFSGFGLGTVLLPVFALFFPLEIAIAATALVHLANNFFKGIMLGRHADIRVTLLFALPAAPMAFIGAWLLKGLSSAEPLYIYALRGKTMEITLFKLVIGLVMVLFALFELSNTFAEKSLNRRFIPLGGMLSGFFGGLSGHQGAFRSLFLLKAGLAKEAFIGTTVLAAVIVDIVRLGVYGFTFISRDSLSRMTDTAGHILVGMVAAFWGILIGSRFIKKITLKFIQIVVGILLLLIAAGLMAGML